MRSFERLQPLALLLLRLGLGIIFIYHGYPKLFAGSHAQMHGFEQMGFPGYFVYVAGILEFFGGILLIAGLFTRIAGLLLAGEMAIAIWRVQLPMGSITAVKDYQFPLAMAIGAFALAAFGAGIISFDHAIYGARARSGAGRAPRKSQS